MFMKSKLTEQVLEKACLAWTFTAATTAVATSVGIDRKGYNTAFFVLQGLCATAGGSFNLNCTVYQTDVSTGTYALVSSATITGSISTTYTFTLLPTSAATTATGKNINLSGLKRFLKIYVAVTAAVTNTITCSVAAILGDAMTEPAT
jgi:hypothetical protein